MIRSTKTTLNFANQSKLDTINQFIDEYKIVVVKIINLIWDLEYIPPLLQKNITSQIETWLSARAIQCAAKQASGIVRGTQIKQKQRLFVINQLNNLGKFKKARKLRSIYNRAKQSKPTIKEIQCELDQRFVKIEFNSNTHFDGWITFSSLGNNIKLQIPFKKHKHFNRLLNVGTIKNGIRLSKKEITFIFDLPEIEHKKEGTTIGIDVGQTTTLSCSNGQVIDKCPHGHTYGTICDKLARKIKNSKNFNKTVKHRCNYLRYIVNKLNLDNVGIVNRENIKNLRKFSNVSRRMKHWNYRELFDVLDRKLEMHGVRVNKLNPTYTSQRCSRCGWTRKDNRKRKKFKCNKCSFECDADLNASINLSFNLDSVMKQERVQQKNKAGFYWNVASKESIVPSVQKTDSYF